jgi:hypothetical protein
MLSLNPAVCWKPLKPSLLEANYDIISESENVKDGTMGNQQATQVELGWLAGIIDGEGYVGLVTGTHSKSGRFTVTPMVCINNTDEAIILRASSIFGKLGITHFSAIQGQYKTKDKLCYKLQVKHQSNLIKLLDCVGEHLTGNKYVRSQLVLAYCESRKVTYIPGKHDCPYTEKELEILEACLPLQRRGASETIRRAQIERSEIRKIQEQRVHELNMREERKCANCGGTMIGSPSRFGKHQTHFCSRECRYTFQRNNHERYQYLIPVNQSVKIESELTAKV